MSLLHQHTLSSNRLAECAVHTFKNGLSRMKEGPIIVYLSHFLFSYRNTPQVTTGSTPAELSMGRRLRSTMDLIEPDLKKRVVEQQER